MDDILHHQFGRIEKALTALVDSIAAYNPSPQAAIQLVAADDELSAGLDQLARHQANHTRIQTLRSEADALEDQLKTSVRKLAELRHELFDTPATTFPQASRAVPFDELLQYATNISKHTVPPTYRERLPAALTDTDKEKEDTGSSGAPTNGVNTPAPAPEVAHPTQPSASDQNANENVAGATPEITPEEEEWLRKLKDSNLAWYPWPSIEKIRMGNLFRLQEWREKGKNMDDFDIPAYLESEATKRLPVHVPQHEEAPAEAAAPQAAVAPRVQKPKEVLSIFDDLDDD